MNIFILSLTCPSKVAYFQLVVFANEEVLRLQVSMHVAIFMYEVNSRQSLNKEIKRCFLRETVRFVLNGE